MNSFQLMLALLGLAFTAVVLLVVLSLGIQLLGAVVHGSRPTNYNRNSPSAKMNAAAYARVERKRKARNAAAGL